MPTSPPILLLDTNVWLDVFLPHRIGRAAAIDLLDAAESFGATLVYPSQAVLDIYQKVRSDNKHWIRQCRELTQADAVAIKRMAWDYINTMRRIATAVPVDANDVALVCAYRDTHDDLEDDLVLAACQRAHATYLVTTDQRLASHAPIDARSPSQMCDLLRTGRAEGASSPTSSSNTSGWLYRWLSQYDTQE